MIKKIVIRSFKSLDSVEVDLGLLNVFIGANGSGKSNFLEAVGVLSAAASGRVNDATLLNRGVRSGVPKLYKSSFLNNPAPPHISLSANNDNSEYSVSLHNPLESPEPDWMYKHERWSRILKSGRKGNLASRGPRQSDQKKLGLAALKAFDIRNTDSAYAFLKNLQDFRIYTPTTSVLRGVAPETQPSHPLGLSGGRLPEALGELIGLIEEDNFYDQITRNFFTLVEWAKEYSICESIKLPLSPSASASPWVIRFIDKYMSEGRNELSGYEASEGALYVLFLTLLVSHPNSPNFCAVDNADHGLNPLLAKSLFKHLSHWILNAKKPKQLLITTHNPLVLDGLLLNNGNIRLFSVNKSSSGKTEIKRIEITEEYQKMAKEGWTLSRLWTTGHLGGIYHV